MPLKYGDAAAHVVIIGAGHADGAPAALLRQYGRQLIGNRKPLDKLSRRDQAGSLGRFASRQSSRLAAIVSTARLKKAAFFA